MHRVKNRQNFIFVLMAILLSQDHLLSSLSLLSDWICSPYHALGVRMDLHQFPQFLFLCTGLSLCMCRNPDVFTHWLCNGVGRVLNPHHSSSCLLFLLSFLFSLFYCVHFSIWTLVSTCLGLGKRNLVGIFIGNILNLWSNRRIVIFIMLGITESTMLSTVFKCLLLCLSGVFSNFLHIGFEHFFLTLFSSILIYVLIEITFFNSFY